MPSPISHLAYAQDFAVTDAPSDKAAYWRGTVFPDIRYLGVIERAKSHRTGVTFHEVSAETGSWQRGYLLHNVVDEAWNAYWRQFGMDTDEPAHRAKWMAVKLLEDELVFADIFDKAGVAATLGVADAGALALGIKSRDIERWGAIVGEMLCEVPSEQSRGRFAGHLDFGAELARIIEEHITLLRADEKWMARIRGCRPFVSKLWGPA